MSPTVRNIAVLAIAWLVADLAMPILIRFARHNRLLDRPYGHKTHRSPTPVLGGVGISIALAAAIGFTAASCGDGFLRPILGITGGALMVMLLGLIDDLRPINAVVKLGVLAVATLLISAFGVQVSVFPEGAGIFNLLLTLIWVAGVTSATNSLDHWNGTTAGSVAIACLTVFIVNLDGPRDATQAWIGSMALAGTGACVGFLRHNLRGGKIFLGDNGSFLLGFIMASSLVFTRWSEDPLKAALLPCIVLTVPLYDITLTTALRIKDGVVGTIRDAIVFCGKDHIAHRLAALGLGPRGTVAAVYALGAVSGGFAIAIHAIPGRIAYLTVFCGYLGVLVVLGAVLDRAPVNPPRTVRRRRSESPEAPRAEVPVLLTTDAS
jgi:UDP-GlcNAc:undecaprenyl-phosphate GlcNAc-1-phosphate transferase